MEGSNLKGTVESRNLVLMGQVAQMWRIANVRYTGGVVLFWQGGVYGWKNKLRDPSSERPGTFAIDDAGHVFVAEGGNDYDGAKCWLAVNLSER